MCPDITSRQHRIVRAFRSAAQGEGDHVLLDGWHLLHEAVDAHVPITTIAVLETPVTDADRRLLNRLAREHAGMSNDDRTDVVTVSAAVMDAVSPARTPSGVVALGRPRRASADALLHPSPALVIVATDVQDPGNAGAIVRSAEAGGATGVWFTGGSADPWGWKALRAAMGSTFRLPVVRTIDAHQALAALRTAGTAIIAAAAQQAPTMYDLDLTRPIALLLGSEGRGLAPDLAAAADTRISIPMSGPVESLNVAAAAAVLVYEARRQRAIRAS